MNNIQDTYSNFIILRTYSRWLEDKQRRETWQDSVYRYRDFLLPKVPDSLKDGFLEAIEAVIRKEIMPSMRLLWTAGKAAEIDNVSAYNCFSGDTRFVTEEGVKNLSDVGTHNVLTSSGEFVEAEVRSFGKQKTREAVFQRGSFKKTLFVTDMHNWKLADGSTKKTYELKKGDKICFIAPKKHVNTESVDYLLGIRHGFIYGDGTLQKGKLGYSVARNQGYQLRICSDIADTLKYFEGYPTTYPPTFKDNPVIKMYDSFAKTHDLKQLPSTDETHDYLVGFFRGWFAADGYISAGNQVQLTTKREDVEWLERIFPKLGYYIQRVTTLPVVTNFGVRKQDTVNVFIDRATLTPDDFLLPRKRDRFLAYDVEFYTFNCFTGEEREEEVFCATVPEVHEFVLENGLLTGNCAYTPIDKINRFHEILYLLMNGVGVGYSVERQYIAKLPTIACQVSENEAEVYTVQDSKEGWALAFKHLVKDWYLGIPSTWDVSKVRPKGALIKTFGGRASGSGVLVDLFTFTKQLIFNALGRKLNSKEISDIVCKIADIVICGGVRRSACICFSNLSDPRMASYKEGQFWLDNPQRALANISVAYTEKPDMAAFIEEWKTLIQSGTGERGIINVECLPDEHMRMNPCAERALRPQQLCNLSEVVVSAEITQDELLKRVRLATLLGTIQATLTQFNTRVLSKEWVNNTIEDAMLGVSLTGTSNKLWTPEELQELRNHAIVSNEYYAKVLNINKAYGITCNKPSGTVSQVVGCSSGIHPDYSEYYIRRVRVAKVDPICQLLINQKVPHNPEVGTSYETTDTMVFEFPIKGSAFRTKENCTAIEQLEYYKLFKTNWCDERGNPSCTVYVKESEWLQVGAWVYENWSLVGGLSFLPADGGVYQLAPYTAITKEEYEKLCNDFPTVDFSVLKIYEKVDTTVGAKEYACTAGQCELK